MLCLNFHFQVPSPNPVLAVVVVLVWPKLKPPVLVVAVCPKDKPVAGVAVCPSENPPPAGAGVWPNDDTAPVVFAGVAPNAPVVPVDAPNPPNPLQICLINIDPPISKIYPGFVGHKTKTIHVEHWIPFGIER